MNIQKKSFKTIGLLMFFILFQFIVACLLVMNLLRGEIVSFLNTIYIGLPICIVLSISCLITIALLIRVLVHGSDKKIQKALIIIWIFCLILCLASVLIFGSTSSVSKEHQLNFQKNFSLNRIISIEYKESSSAYEKYSARNWGNTEYFRSSLSENLDNMKVVELDDRMRAQMPNISVQYSVMYVTNIPLWLQNHVNDIMDLEFNMEFEKFSKRDRSKIEKLEYENTQITLYHDHHIDLETDRVLCLIHYNGNYLLLSLIFQDLSGNLQVDSSQVLENAVVFFKAENQGTVL